MEVTVRSARATISSVYLPFTASTGPWVLCLVVCDVEKAIQPCKWQSTGRSSELTPHSLSFSPLDSIFLWSFTIAASIALDSWATPEKSKRRR